MILLIDSTAALCPFVLVGIITSFDLVLFSLIAFVIICVLYFLHLKFRSNNILSLKKEVSSLQSKISELNSEVNTRTKNLEHALQRAEEANRLKSLFLANMSHEIRTPLNGIMGFSELIIDPEIEGQMKQEFATHITQNSEQLLKLIDQIFHLSVIETGKVRISREEFRIKLLLLTLERKFVKKIQDSKKKIKLVLNTNLKEDKIITDYEKLNLIVENLFDNALKFTDRGTITIDYFKEKEEYLFKISDTGCGIGEDEYDIIFDPFTQGRETMRKIKGGSGLGLSNVKNYVILLGGKVWCENNQPCGLIFYFTLPSTSANNHSAFRADFHTVRN
jgi:signal transduction histidine kinase